MQILGGKFRGLQLQSLPSEKVRPTARRVRERLFQLLDDRVAGARLLDLCAGSGSIGIEALSRGASHVTFVDRSTPACAHIRLNLGLCGIGRDEAVVAINGALAFLKHAIEQGAPRWNIAYFDPPYSADYRPVLECFASGSLLKPGGLLVVEHQSNYQPEPGGCLEYLGTAQLCKSCISFFEQKR